MGYGISFNGDCIFDHIQLRTDFNLLLMSLLSGELVVACIGIPLDFYAAARLVVTIDCVSTVLVYLLFNQLFSRRGWDLGTELCQATGFLLTFLGMASINNLVAISVFRYLVIHYANVRELVELSPEYKVIISE